jgi:hypothetical protein
MKFRIERRGSVPPPKRGPKPMIAEYHRIPLDQMEPGDSIKIAEVPRTKRNSTYLSVLGVLKPKFEELGGLGIWKVTTTLQPENGEMVDVRVWRLGKNPEQEPGEK